MSERHQLRLSGVWRPAPADRPLPRLPVPQLRAGDRGDRSRRTTGGRMTPVRRLRRVVFQRFKTDWRISLRRTKSGLKNETRLGEDSRGGRFHPCFPTHVFSRLRRKPIALRLATGLRNGADVAVRRAHSEVILHMQPDTSDERSGLDVQQQPVLWLHPERGVLN